MTTVFCLAASVLLLPELASEREHGANEAIVLLLLPPRTTSVLAGEKALV